MTWRPIIEPGRVASVLREIVDAVEAHPRTHHSELADYAILRTYLDSDDAIPDRDDRGGGALVEAIEGLAEQGANPSLYGGAARIGWTVAHHASGNEADAVCDAIDAALVRHLEGWIGDYDLISGLVGFGVYAVERGEPGAGVAAAVVTGLERYREHGWLTPPELLPEHQRLRAPDGYVNLGLAHGIPGVLAVLAQFCRCGFERERSRVLLESALRRLLDSSPRLAGGRFVAWQPSAYPPSARLAWCYGDLGVAAALLGAGLAAEHAEARTEGLGLAVACAARSFEEASITDTGLCHGAAGIAHLFNRMAQATGEPALHDAAVRWIDHTLAMRRDEPLAGFPANMPEDDGKAKYIADGTMLTGAGGVALTLHAASSEVEPVWDRLLLVDMPTS
jgi:hypothetical protein